MRIWSLHPKYLDSKGLVALWRETLLAKNVLEGNTKGYTNHPQLQRFKESLKPLDSINHYLSFVFEESMNRNYNFDKSKFSIIKKWNKINVTQGQLNYEFDHLLNKLKTRDVNLFRKWKATNKIEPHPIFRIVKGDIETWEKVS